MVTQISPDQQSGMNTRPQLTYTASSANGVPYFNLNVDTIWVDEFAHSWSAPVSVTLAGAQVAWPQDASFAVMPLSTPDGPVIVSVCLFQDTSLLSQWFVT
jgi:hypothetical protein